jgi:hypothetical protein
MIIMYLGVRVFNGFQKKQRLFLYTVLNYLFIRIIEAESVYYAVRTESLIPTDPVSSLKIK